MSLIADLLLVAGAGGAAMYCMILSRRMHRLTRLESGMGGAIAVLSAQVDDMTRMLGRAQNTAQASSSALESQTGRAEDALKRLEVMLAALHDLPQLPDTEPAAREAGRRGRIVRRRPRPTRREDQLAPWEEQR